MQQAIRISRFDKDVKNSNLQITSLMEIVQIMTMNHNLV